MKSLLKISSVLFIYFVLYSGMAMAAGDRDLVVTVPPDTVAPSSGDRDFVLTSPTTTLLTGPGDRIFIAPTSTIIIKEEQQKERQEQEMLNIKERIKKMKKLDKEHQHAVIMKSANKVRFTPIKHDRVVNLPKINR